MSHLEWIAKGIEDARNAGGVELECYQRPGFTGGNAVRRARAAYVGSGIYVDGPWHPDPETHPVNDRHPPANG